MVTFADNHDVPRLMYKLHGNVNRFKLALANLLTTRGIPQLLYGTELGITGGT
jgi:glycosidase